MSTSQPELDDFAELRQAREHWNRGDRTAGLARYLTAVDKAPDNLRGLLECARALGRVYRISEAENLLVRARTIAGHDERVLPPLVQAFNEVFRPAEAIETLESARAAGRLSPPLLGELAVLYERSNNLDRAMSAIQECLERAPTQAEPRLVLARLQRRLRRMELAEDTLRDLVSTVTDRPLVLVQAWSELCQLCDQQGDYEGAWSANENAKQIYRRFPEAERMSRRAIALNAAFRELAEKLDTATVTDWRQAPLSPDPRCFGVAHLIGFPRSGTTLLEQCLDAHPQLVDSPERSVFTQDILPAMLGPEGLGADALRSISTEQIQDLRNRYFNAMEAIHGSPLAGRLHVDKNPNHTSLIAALLRFFPESRFLFALRDPRDVLVSVYLRTFPLTEFGAGLLTPGSVCLMYAHDMDIWLRMRPLLAGQWLEVKYEDTVADLERQARRTVDFLGLTWDARVLDYRRIAERKVVNSPSHDQVREPIYQRAVARWKNYERHLGPYFDRLGPYLKALGYG